MKDEENFKEVVIYQTKSGAIQIKKDVKSDTIWATQAQIGNIFGVDRSVITKHINNILSDKELEAVSVCAKFAHTGNDSKTYQVQFYNLDVILAVGYRTNSVRAIEFRKWATETLHRYIVDGYAINKDRIAYNYQQFLEAVDDLKHLLPAGATIDAGGILDLINMFASTWFSLDAYDKDALKVKGTTKKKVILTAAKLSASLADLKHTLISKGEATDLFGSERSQGNVAGIVGNIMQTFGGKDLYGSVEEKAAHLLYFMVKDHPFVDGNKRSGAYAFIWFLRLAKILDTKQMTPPALTALTILVAESDPKEKEKMIRLILTLLS